MMIAEHICEVTEVGGDRVAIDLDGDTLSWTALGEGITAIGALLGEAGVGEERTIGVLGRNRLEQLGSFIALLGAGRAVLLVNAVRPPALIAEEVAELNLAAIIGSAPDLTSELLAAAGKAGTMAIRADAQDGRLRFEAMGAPGEGPF